MPEYNYLFDDDVQTVKDFSTPRDQLFFKDGNVFRREIEMEDNVIKETRQIIRTTIEVFMTAAWTDGKQTDLRVAVPVEYVEGFESEIVQEIIDIAREHILNYGEGFERLDEGTFELKEEPLPEEADAGEIEFVEKPVFEREIVEGEVKQTERDPNIIEVGGRGIERVTGKKGIGATVGRAVQGVGRFIGRFFK